MSGDKIADKARLQIETIVGEPFSQDTHERGIKNQGVVALLKMQQNAKLLSRDSMELHKGI